MPGAPDVVFVSLRAIAFVAGFQAAGTVLFLALVRPQLTIIDRDTRQLVLTAAVIALVATVAQHALGPARMTGQFGDVLDPSLQRFVFESAAGTARVARVLGLGLLTFGVATNVRSGNALAIAGACLTVASFGLMGHTTTHEPAWLLRIVLILHVLFVAFWFGALLPLRHALEHEPRHLVADSVDRFSAVAVRTVPALFVAGLVIAALLIQTPDRLATPYGRMLLAKVAGFGLVVAFAAFNYLRVTPALRAGRQGAAKMLRTSILIEWLLIAAILVTTAALTSLFSPDV